MITRAILTENNFKKLISGATVQLKGLQGSKETTIEIILHDIGYSRMLKLIRDEVLSNDPYFFDQSLD